MSVKPTEEQLHRAKLLIGDPQAQALERIRAYARSLTGTDYDDDGDECERGVTADELIYTAMHNINLEEGGWDEYISKGGLLEGVSTSAAFWEDLAIYKVIDIPTDKRHSFFSCSC